MGECIMTERNNVSRRRVLRGAGLAVTAALFPRAAGLANAAPQQPGPSLQPGQTRADFPVSDVTRQLGTYMSQARDRALPTEVVEHARLHILDTVASMVSGADLPAGRSALAFARAYGGKSVATVVADTVLLSPIEAALVNATLAHADETDDAVSPGPWHPGACVVPPALAVGEQFHITGAQFVRAVVLGYDVGTRVLAAVGNGPATTHRAPYPLGGVFGAAAAGGSAAGLNAEQMRLVLAYSAETSAGIEAFPRDPDHTEKAYMFAGQPAQGGVTAVLLVQAGWTGVNDIFAGPENFLEHVTPSPRRDLLVEKLGERYDVTRTDIKRWTVGFPIQAPLDAMQELLKRQPIDPAHVQEIVLRYQPGSITDNSGAPDINVQQALAVMIVDRAATFRALHDRARLQDPIVMRLRTKVRIVQAQGRGGGGIPLLQIVMTDGTRLTQENAVPVSAMTRERVAAKARELMTPVLGASQTIRLIDRIFDLEKVKDIRELRPLLQTAPLKGAPRLSTYPAASVPGSR
jgi:2-methylcitrate dehydratase PrpD